MHDNLSPAHRSFVPRGTSLAICTNRAHALCGGAFAPVPKNGRVRMVCYKDEAQSFTGVYGSKRWFYVQVQASGWYGYVHSSFVQQQTPRTPNCDSKPDLVAAQWAATTYNQVEMNPSENVWNQAAWQPGPFREWSGDCPKLVVRAWQYAGRSVPGADARNIFTHYQRRGAIRQGTPPRGAVVFWSRGSSGHTAVSLGNGYAIGTVGEDRERKPVGFYPTATPDYLGWAMP
jgi:hypothetical protein